MDEVRNLWEKHVDAGFFVTERLVETVITMPEAVVDCLRLMIEGARDRWEPDKWRDGMREILGKAIKADGSQGRPYHRLFKVSAGGAVGGTDSL